MSSILFRTPLVCLVVVTGLVIAKGGGDHLPQQVDPEKFEALKSKSPFTRTLNLPSSLLLTGLASIENDTIATLADTKSGESHVVSQNPNAQGWKLVDVSRLNDLSSARATISFEGGETVRVTHDSEKQRAMAKGLKPSGGSSSGSKITKSPQKSDSSKEAEKQKGLELRKRFESLTEAQRKTAGEMIKKAHQSSPKMSSEERMKMYNGVIDKVSSGKR